MHWRLFADLAEAAETREVSLDLDAEATVDDALETLVERHPELREHVYEDGRLAGHLTVLRNGSNIETEADGLATKITPDDELALFPPISGG